MLIECKGSNKKWNLQIFEGIFVKKDQKWIKKSAHECARRDAKKHPILYEPGMRAMRIWR